MCVHIHIYIYIYLYFLETPKHPEMVRRNRPVSKYFVPLDKPKWVQNGINNNGFYNIKIPLSIHMSIIFYYYYLNWLSIICIECTRVHNMRIYMSTILWTIKTSIYVFSL